MDANAEKLKGELMDLQHGSSFINDVKIQGSSGKTMLHWGINLGKLQMKSYSLF